MVQQNELVKRYGLQTHSASVLDSQAWMAIPTCLGQEDDKKGNSGSGSTKEPGVSESMDGAYEYTSPLSGDTKWITGYRCRLCYNGKFISLVGHRIVAPGRKDKPWTHVIESDFASPDLRDSVEQQIHLLFEKVPEFYSNSLRYPPDGLWPHLREDEFESCRAPPAATSQRGKWSPWTGLTLRLSL